MRQPFGKTWYSEVKGIGFTDFNDQQRLQQEEERENP
jgi:hypothetical protein